MRKARETETDRDGGTYGKATQLRPRPWPWHLDAIQTAAEAAEGSNDAPNVLCNMRN